MKRDSAVTVDVLGAGAWGTALAMVLDREGHRVRVWGHDAAYAAEIEATRRNPKYLPDVEIPRRIRFSGEPLEAHGGAADTVFSVVPTQKLRAILQQRAGDVPPAATVVSCSKGFEVQPIRRPAEIIQEVLPGRRIVVLSGPSHAEEVSRALPAALVAASDDIEAAQHVQSLLSGALLRVYTSEDVVGVEVGGATKNIIAIACGISDGLGFGDNTRAALMTRGLHEMTRLGLALGGEAQTFAGLSGMGDLVVTCASKLSRNWTVGYRVGCGESLEAIVGSTEKVAEGIPTTRSIRQLARDLRLDLPITREVHAVLFEGKRPRSALTSLMTRESKREPE